MTTIVERFCAQFTALGSDLDQRIAELTARIETLERKNADQAAELAAMGRKLRDVDAGLNRFRSDATRRRDDLPSAARLALHTQAREYTRLVNNDLRDLAELALHRRPDQDAGTSPEEREARTVAMLAEALLLTGKAPDRKTLTKLVGKDARLDEVIDLATTMRAQMAEHGAHFDNLAEIDVSSEGLRLWPGCRPGAVEFVVAPAFMDGDVPIGDQEGEPAGPWVYTRAVGG